MLTRPIPKTGEALPVIGLGTWQTFDVGASEKERAPRREVLTRLFAGGGTVVDSSPMYGRAEDVSGDLLAGLGLTEKAFIATKVWTAGRAKGVAEMEESMRLFRTGCIDLMQIHNLVDWRTQLATLRDWKAAGRVRYIGITHYTAGAFREVEDVLRAEEMDFLQIPYSIALRDAERRLLPLCLDLGVAVMPNRPFEGGTLFRDLRRTALPDWAAGLGCASWGQVFLKFLLSHPAVTCVIPGTADPAHLDDNLAAGEGYLPTEAEREKLAALCAS